MSPELKRIEEVKTWLRRLERMLKRDRALNVERPQSASLIEVLDDRVVRECGVQCE